MIYISESIAANTDFSYTGVKIEIPAQTIAILQFDAVYKAGKPVSVGVSKSSTEWRDATFVTVEDYPRKCFVLHSPQNSTTVYYVWAAYSTISNNTIKITGLLFPR